MLSLRTAITTSPKLMSVSFGVAAQARCRYMGTGRGGLEGKGGREERPLSGACSFFSRPLVLPRLYVAEQTVLQHQTPVTFTHALGSASGVRLAGPARGGGLTCSDQTQRAPIPVPARVSHL